MIESCAPQNQVELELLGRLAATNWSLDRAARAEAAQISQRVRNYAIERERGEEEEAFALGQRLFWTARGPWQLYPHHPHTGSKSETRTSWSQDPADPNNPALLVLRLQRTVAGCRWLLERWAELRSRLEPGEVWAASDQFKAIRLLGKQPLDAVDDLDVTLICLASAKLLPDGDATKAFALVKHELHNGKDEPQTYSKELRKQPLAKLRPADAGAAREALCALVDRQTSRLKLILARNQEIAEADAAEAPDRLAVDPSPEGEKLRRYALLAARVANQTISAFLPVVRCPLSVETEDRRAGLENVGGGDFARDWEHADPFADRMATIGEAALREMAEAAAASVQHVATMSAAEAAPRNRQSEPNPPPAMAQPVASFNPEPAAGRPLRTEANTPPEDRQPSFSQAPKPIPDAQPESELAQLNMCRAVLHSLSSPSERPAMTSSERTEVNQYRAQVHSKDSPSVPPEIPPSERSEADPAVEKSQPKDSQAVHSVPRSAAALDSTLGGAIDLGPFDVTDRRYFGARMSAARGALAEAQTTSPTNQYRSSPRKRTKRR
jgi:hypothetical protein